MPEALAIIVLGLTILAFIQKNPLLHFVCIIAWLFMTFYLYNQTWPAENTYLPIAVALLGLSMMLAHIATVTMYYIGLRTVPKTHNEIQLAHRKKVLSITRRKKKQWWERE